MHCCLAHPSPMRYLSLLLLATATSGNQNCRTYFAPSTIPGAGMGLFAGQSFDYGQEVTPGDIVVPIVEIDWHTGDNGGMLWDEYTWGAESFPGMPEDAETVSGASPGIGAIPNCLYPHINVEETKTTYEPSRTEDGPRRGANTPYHNRISSAIRPIQAGQEIFVDYGYNYFTTRENLFGYIPKMDDYDNINALLQTFRTIIQNHPLLQMYNITLDVYQTMREILTTSKKNLHWITPEELWDGTTRIEDIVHNNLRNLTYLQEHGTCTDNLRAGESEISGRGAFATRNLPKGSIVAPLPLIHVYDKDRFTMFAEHNPQKSTRDTTRPIHHQLLLNYCWGHEVLDFLLCPYGVATSLINHDTTPNVRLEWVDSPWLEESPQTWLKKSTARLVMNVVATRDIQEGEEVVVDYGSAWQAAWDAHVADWKEPEERLDAQVYNELKDNGIFNIIRTDNVQLYCHDYALDLAGLTFLTDYDGFNTESDEPLWDCRIIGVNNDSYTAEVVRYIREDDTSHIEVAAIAFGLSRDAFYYRNTMYGKDYYQTWSFRKEMGLPDDLIPGAWR